MRIYQAKTFPRALLHTSGAANPFSYPIKEPVCLSGYFLILVDRGFFFHKRAAAAAFKPKRYILSRTQMRGGALVGCVEQQLCHAYNISNAQSP